MVKESIPYIHDASHISSYNFHKMIKISKFYMWDIEANNKIYSSHWYVNNFKE